MAAQLLKPIHTVVGTVCDPDGRNVKVADLSQDPDADTVNLDVTNGARGEACVAENPAKPCRKLPPTEMDKVAMGDLAKPMKGLATANPDAQFRSFEMEDMLVLNFGTHEAAWFDGLAGNRLSNR